MKKISPRLRNEIQKRIKEYANLDGRHTKREGNIPQNFGQNTFSSYHTALTSKEREYDDDANFDKEDSGQPDLEETAIMQPSFVLDLIPRSYFNQVDPKSKKKYTDFKHELIQMLNKLYKSNGIDVIIRESKK